MKGKQHRCPNYAIHHGASRCIAARSSSLSALVPTRLVEIPDRCGRTPLSWAAIGGHAACVTARGRVFTWGAGREGALGDGALGRTPRRLKKADLVGS